MARAAPALDPVDASRILTNLITDSISPEDAAEKLTQCFSVKVIIEGLDLMFSESIAANHQATLRDFLIGSFSKLPPKVREVYESALIACDDGPVHGAAMLQTGEQVNLEMISFRVLTFYIAQSLVDKFDAKFKGRPVTEQMIARFIPLIRTQLPENAA